MRNYWKPRNCRRQAQSPPLPRARQRLCASWRTRSKRNDRHIWKIWSAALPFSRKNFLLYCWHQARMMRSSQFGLRPIAISPLIAEKCPPHKSTNCRGSTFTSACWKNIVCRASVCFICELPDEIYSWPSIPNQEVHGFSRLKNTKAIPAVATEAKLCGSTPLFVSTH